MSNKQLKCEDPDCPQVNFFSIRLTVNELRRNVVNSPAKSSSSLVDCMCWPAEVAKFDVHSFNVTN